MKHIFFSFVVLACIAFFGCDQKFDTANLPNPNQTYSKNDTNYIEVTPPFGGPEVFQIPVAVIVGNDQLIYVADYDSNQIVMMNAAGVVLKRRTILHPIAIAQNLKLDLYVCGEAIAPNGKDTIGVLYRIYLARFDTVIGGVQQSTFINHELETAPLRIVRRETEHPKRRYVGVGIMPGNEYLLARTGPDNSSFVDPDTKVLIMDKNDKLTNYMSVLITQNTGGTAINDIYQLTGLTVFPSSRDFIVLQSTELTTYGAIWMTYVNNSEMIGWQPKFDPLRQSIGFLLTHFDYPTAAAVDKRRSDVFIIDSGLDSLIKFDRNGVFKAESFGKSKSASNDLPGLNHPMGVAFSSDCTLYIADSGNRLIRRFRLSSQTSCY